MVIIPDLIWNGFTMNGREDLAIDVGVADYQIASRGDG